jgi:hypothetical protein
MKRYPFLIVIVAIILLFLSCDTTKPEAPSRDGKIILITSNKEVILSFIAGEGWLTIDWGDGESTTEYIHPCKMQPDPITTLLQMPGTFHYRHSYERTKRHNITISIDGHIRMLFCNFSGITDVYISETAPIYIFYSFSNLLRSFSANQNQTLEFIHLGKNLLSVHAIDRAFISLKKNDQPPVYVSDRSIYIDGNPGRSQCNTAIAETKGWMIDYIPYNLPIYIIKGE